MIRKIKFYMRNLGKLVCVLGYRRWFMFLSDKAFIRFVWRLRYKHKLNLENPVTYTEKIQWLKLNDHNPLYRVIADKWNVRNHIEHTIGAQFLVPIHAVYESLEDIKWHELPNEFVMKCTHDSGYVLVCKDRSKLNITKAIKELRFRMNHSVYWYGREWQYKSLNPKIIVEEYLSDENEGGIIDYKVFCFNGKVKLFQVHTGRFSMHYQQFYDVDWNLTDIAHVDIPSTKEIIVPKPSCYSEMIRLSELLSKDIPHSRIDWYYVNEKLIFSEYTLYDGSGFISFINEEDNILLGSWIDLGRINKHLVEGDNCE